MVEGYPNSLAGWGAPAIFKEAGRLLGKYFRLLHPFIAAFFLPVVVIELLQLWGFAWGISHHPHHPHPHPHPHHHHHHLHLHHHLHHHFGGFYRAFFIHHSYEGGRPGLNENLYVPAPSPHPHPPPPHPPLLALLLFAAIGILLWLLTSLAIASISRAIAHIYSQDPPDSSPSSTSVTKSIFQSLPSSLYRIFITTLLILLFTFVSTFLISLPFRVLGYFLHSKVLIIINIVVVDIVLIILAFVFLLALEVAVLEPENYGLAALKRSWKLVQSKIGPSLIFFLANIVVGGVLSNLAKAAVFYPATGKLPFWTVYVFGVVWALLYLAFLVYFLVVAVVLYFSTKLKLESEGEYLPVNTREEYAPPVVPSEN